MTNELVKILEAAKFYNDRSMKMYKWAEKAEKENDREYYEMYWKWTCELDERVKGLLEAYEILTGNKIYPHMINDEFIAMA